MVPGYDVPDVRRREVAAEVRAPVVAPGALLPHRHPSIWAFSGGFLT